MSVTNCIAKLFCQLFQTDAFILLRRTCSRNGELVFAAVDSPCGFTRCNGVKINIPIAYVSNAS